MGLFGVPEGMMADLLLFGIPFDQFVRDDQFEVRPNQVVVGGAKEAVIVLEVTDAGDGQEAVLVNTQVTRSPSLMVDGVNEAALAPPTFEPLICH